KCAASSLARAAASRKSAFGFSLSKYSTRQGHQRVSMSFFGNSADISNSFFLREAVSFPFGESRFTRRKVEQPFLSLLFSFRAEIEEPLKYFFVSALRRAQSAECNSPVSPLITKPTRHAPLPVGNGWQIAATAGKRKSKKGLHVKWCYSQLYHYMRCSDESKSCLAPLSQGLSGAQ